jgi:hypothetical protein
MTEPILETLKAPLLESLAIVGIPLAVWLVRRDAKRKGRALSPPCAMCKTEIGMMNVILGRYSYIGDRRAHRACARRVAEIEEDRMFTAARNLVATARKLAR